MKIIKEGNLRVVQYDTFWALDYSDNSIGVTLSTFPSKQDAISAFQRFIDSN